MQQCWRPHVPAHRQPVLLEPGIYAPGPCAGGTGMVPALPGSAGGPGTAPQDVPHSHLSLLSPEILNVCQGLFCDCEPASPETPDSGGPPASGQTERPGTAPTGRAKYGQRRTKQKYLHSKILILFKKI